MNWGNKTILLTGATGSFGQTFIAYFLKQKKFKGVIRAFSRDEYKQHQLEKKFNNDKRLRFFVGDVRDLPRIKRAMEGVEIVVHAAALKQVPALEYNPFEAVKTNILGTENIIDAAIDTSVKKAILISSDKAVSPVNLYGATKLVAEKLFIQGNSYVGNKSITFSVVRYGNVAYSRGSVIPYFQEQAKKNLLTVTDERMTRFWITLSEGVKFVIDTFDKMHGGEIFVPKLPSFKIIDLARTIAPKARIKITGIRPGEKIHEFLIGPDEARNVTEFRNYFIIKPYSLPAYKIRRNDKGLPLKEGFNYSSNNNSKWLTAQEIEKKLKYLTSRLNRD